MTKLRTIILLGAALTLASCQPTSGPAVVAVDQRTPEAGQSGQETVVKAPSQVAVEPMKDGYTLTEPTLLFPSVEMKNSTTSVPAGSVVKIAQLNHQFAELRVNIGGVIYQAWVRPGDVFVGTANHANDIIRERRCEANLGRPESEEILSGELLNRTITPLSSDYISDDEFLGLGLVPVYDDGEHYPEPALYDQNYLNEVVVTASGQSDVYVKVKRLTGEEVVGFFVRAGTKASTGIPEGSYHFYFASGKRFSISCGKFMTDMITHKDPTVRTFDEGDTMIYDLTPRRVPTSSPGYFSGDNFIPRKVNEIEFM